MKNIDNNHQAVEETYHEKILIVDDDPSVRDILSRYLKKNGYYIDSAEDGIIAIEKLKRNDFDLVLTDIKMPNLDGREVLKLMAEKFQAIPKIVMSGQQNNEDIILSLKTGAYDFLNKPIMDFNLLLYAVKRALETKKLNDERNKYTEQLTQINEIISMLNQGSNTEEIFNSLSVTLKKIIPFNRLALATMDDNNNFIIKLVESDRKIFLGKNDIIPYEDSFLTWVAENRKVLIINEFKQYLSGYPKAKSVKMLMDEGMKSCLVLPLIINNKTRGFLNFCSIEGNFFKKNHITFLESIVGQISLSIQRGELLYKLEEYTKNLEETVEKRTKEVIRTQKTTIYALSSLAEAKDVNTGKHIDRIRQYCVLITQILKYELKKLYVDSQYIRDIHDSSILHDIGKVGIPDSILQKPGPLTPKEFEIIKTHTTIGYESLKQASRDLGKDSFLNMALDIVLYHHERWDGKGYPKGLKGEDIPLSARIVAVADIYDALTSVRPYKEKFSHEQSIQIMETESSRFDPLIFEIFLRHEDEFNRIRMEFI